MGVIRNALRWLALRAISVSGISPRDPAVMHLFHMNDTEAGEDINEGTALNFSAVWNAVNLIAGTLARLPCLAYQRNGDGGKTVMDAHPAHHIMHVEPNPEMTPMLFKEAMHAHVLLWGNCYGEIEFNKGGEPIAIWPLNPASVYPVRKRERDPEPTWAAPGELIYRIKALAVGTDRFLAAREMFHVPGLSFDGILGYPVVQMARECFGLGLATERFGARFFGHGLSPSMYLKHPAHLGPKAIETLREDFEHDYGGGQRSHRLMILEEGMDIGRYDMKPEDAQFLQTRQFQVTEVARWFNLPPHMLRDLMRSTNNNIEQQNLDFLIYTMTPWFVRWEQEAQRKLFKGEERKSCFMKFDIKDLLRSDLKVTAAFLTQMTNAGIYNVDEARDVLDKDPLPNGEGKDYRHPATLVTAGEADADAEPDDQGLGAGKDVKRPDEPGKQPANA